MKNEEFMKKNCIVASSSSFYFQLGHNAYRVSNHKMSDSEFHVGYLEKDVIEIIVDNPKHKIQKIYNSLKARHFGAKLHIAPVGKEPIEVVVDLYKTSGMDYNRLIKEFNIKPIGYEGE